MASGIASALGGGGGGLAGKVAAMARKRGRGRNSQAGGNGDEWKSSVDERLVALEQGGDASSQSTPDIGAAPVSEDMGGAASAITGGVANMATESNFSPDTKMAAEGMFGTDADRAASVQGKPNMMESPQISASAELGALFEKPETSYSAIGG